LVRQGNARTASKDGDVGAAAGVSADNDVGVTVAVDVPAGHVAAAREVHVEGEEVADLRAILAAKDDDVRPAARPGAADNVSITIAVDVADRHTDAAREARIEGEETGGEGAGGGEDFDVRPAAGVCRSHEY